MAQRLLEGVGVGEGREAANKPPFLKQLATNLLVTALKQFKNYPVATDHTELSNNPRFVTYFHRFWSFPFKCIISHTEMFLFIVPHTTNRIKNTHTVSIEQTIQLRCYKHVSKWWSSEMELYNYLVLFKENRKLKDIHVKVTCVYHQRTIFLSNFL